MPDTATVPPPALPEGAVLDAVRASCASILDRTLAAEVEDELTVYALLELSQEALVPFAEALQQCGPGGSIEDIALFGMMSLYIGDQALTAQRMRDIAAADIASHFRLPLQHEVPHPTMSFLFSEMGTHLLASGFSSMGGAVKAAAERAKGKDSGTNMVCQGMYKRGDIHGSRNASINVVFPDKPASDASISLVMYNWEDELALGTPKTYICDDEAMQFKLCNETRRGQFLTTPIAGQLSPIVTQYVQLRHNASRPDPVVYPVEQTGWYCVNAVSLTEFEATVEWHSSFGEAPASEYPKLIFYGIFSLIYLLMFAAWAAKSYFNWSDILPVQNYIAGLMFYLTVEMAVHYGFWEDYNNRGEPSMALMIMLAVLNAGRNSLSFFLLLIVSLGYGVVRPSLGGAMFRCKLLAYVHFICGALYASGTMLTTPETAGLLVLVFHILNGLTVTTQLLETRKQHVKLAMYRRLWRILVLSVILLGLFFIVNTASVTHQNDPDWVARRWRYQWFILDGWLNAEYFLVFSLIAFFWRPTSQNQRYGLQELPSNEQDAEDAFALDDDEDEEGHGFRVVGSGGNGNHIRLGQVGGGGGGGASRAREVGLGGHPPVGEPIFDIADEEEDEEDEAEGGKEPRQRQHKKASDNEHVEEIEAEARSDTVIVQVGGGGGGHSPGLPSAGTRRIGRRIAAFNEVADSHPHMIEPLSEMDTAKARLYNNPPSVVRRHSSISMPSIDHASRLPADDPQAHEETEAALLAVVRTHLLPDHAYRACDAFVRDWLTLLAVPGWNDAERRDSLLGLTVRYLTPGELEGGLEAVDRCITTEVFASMCTLGSRLLQLEQMQAEDAPTSMMEEE
ncbi:lung seven transmembrane receptor-domain-containing protein [Syncephalis pseudoplumigaleata]|uniref:Lung seven transmembrane receptor-domain-containing protein n=1 Tax=Syncephalis pseudoplumigaleata TaxID=1712513 RepID=A0A4P9Z6K4_9FUNG|nr:lung seven transmembrane receptor-domain-containing protein [Syncephalis pseudoplumigaleata]|eukprot:RKP27481.1 lung seven transmembrane receptor-domain-containing protein [Syncephalis pseudoplumigaleata]